MSEQSDNADWQAAQHQDELLRQQALLEQLLELHRLVDACSNYTTLNEIDVRNIAVACGVYDLYIQAIQPKPKLEHAHENR